MIEFKQGNILESDTEIIVITVNTKGVMGAGLALASKKIFPDNYKAYKKYCEEGLLKPGKLFVYIQKRGSLGPLTIVNFATKDHWRNDSRIEWIKSGLGELRNLMVDLDYKSCSIPALGCSNGHLLYDDVKPLIVNMCESLPDVKFYIYEPL